MLMKCGAEAAGGRFPGRAKVSARTGGSLEACKEASPVTSHINHLVTYAPEHCFSPGDGRALWGNGLTGKDRAPHAMQTHRHTQAVAGKKNLERGVNL